MSRSSRSPRRFTRPGCEALEGRTMLSASAFAPAPSLVPGYATLAVKRLTDALEGLEAQLSTANAVVPGQAPLSADLNGDGVPDTVQLVPLQGSSEMLRVVFGASATRPAATYEMALDQVARRLIVGDFDGDGRLDLFAEQGGAGKGTLLLGEPGGLFDAVRLGGRDATLAVADRPDGGGTSTVYTAGDPTRVVIDGPGGRRTFTAALMDMPACEVHLADVNGDGRPDLVVTTADGSVSAFAGLGGGEFSTSRQTLADVFSGTGAVHVAFAKVVGTASPGLDSGEAHGTPLEMAVASTARGEVAVYSGAGLTRKVVAHVGLAPSAITLADVNGDGVPDLVVTCAGEGAIVILKGLAGGLFDEHHVLILPTGNDPVDALVGSFDGTKRVGLVSVDQGGNGLTYYPDLSDPSPHGQHLDSGGVAPTAALVRDVNGDGYGDLIVANQDGHVTLFLGGPNGLTESQTIYLPGTRPESLAFGAGLAANQFYMLDAASQQVEILSFAPQGAPAADGQNAGPPALESSSGVAVVFERVSAATAEVLPTLLAVATDPEAEGVLVAAMGSPAAAPLPGGGGRTAAEEAASPGEATVELRIDDPPAAAAVRRYLLNVDSVPPPALEAAGPGAADPQGTPAAPAGAAGPMASGEDAGPEPVVVVARREARAACPAEAAGGEAEAADGPGPARVAAPEAPPLSDLLLGVALLVGRGGVGWQGPALNGRGRVPLPLPPPSPAL